MNLYCSSSHKGRYMKIRFSSIIYKLMKLHFLFKFLHIIKISISILFFHFLVLYFDKVFDDRKQHNEFSYYEFLQKKMKYKFKSKNGSKYHIKFKLRSNVKYQSDI